jgi:hypothetical protein
MQEQNQEDLVQLHTRGIFGIHDKVSKNSFV